MISTRTGNTTKVTLSRRNLLALLAKLDGYPPESACELYKDFGSDVGRIRVLAEEDGPHYKRTELPYPGPMHPATEARIKC